MFWPDQLLKDSVAALAVLAAVLALTDLLGGAELTAPADPANPYAAARPETYFLFLFQFSEVVSRRAGSVGGDRHPDDRVACCFSCRGSAAAAAGICCNVCCCSVCWVGGPAHCPGTVTMITWRSGPTARRRMRKSTTPRPRFCAKREAAHEAERVIESGPDRPRRSRRRRAHLMHDDPYLQGPKLFAQHCAELPQLSGSRTS